MRTCKRLSYLTLLLITLFTATSCMEGNGNYQTYKSLTGSIISDSNKKYLRLDNRSTLYYADEFQSYKEGDRLLVSFTINYDQQTNSSYTTVTDVTSLKFSLQNTTDISDEKTDSVIGNNPIYSVNSSFLSLQGKSIIYTVNPLYYGSNDNHIFNLVRNKLASNAVKSDTLKLEFRHNKKEDTNSSTLKSYLVSFDLTSFLSGVSVGTTKVIEIKYNLSTTENNKEYFTYTPTE